MFKFIRQEIEYRIKNGINQVERSINQVKLRFKYYSLVNQAIYVRSKSKNQNSNRNLLYFSDEKPIYHPGIKEGIGLFVFFSGIKNGENYKFQKSVLGFFPYDLDGTNDLGCTNELDGTNLMNNANYPTSDYFKNTIQNSLIRQFNLNIELSNYVDSVAFLDGAVAAIYGGERNIIDNLNKALMDLNVANSYSHRILDPNEIKSAVASPFKKEVIICSNNEWYNNLIQ